MLPPFLQVPKKGLRLKCKSIRQTKIRNFCLSVILEFCLLSVVCLYLGRTKTLPYVWKKYHKNERHLCLLASHICTKLSQNACLINNLMYRYARCNCYSYGKSINFIAFLGIFIHLLAGHNFFPISIEFGTQVGLVKIQVKFKDGICAMWVPYGTLGGTTKKPKFLNLFSHAQVKFLI